MYWLIDVVYVVGSADGLAVRKPIEWATEWK